MYIMLWMRFRPSLKTWSAFGVHVVLKLTSAETAGTKTKNELIQATKVLRALICKCCIHHLQKCCCPKLIERMAQRHHTQNCAICPNRHQARNTFCFDLYLLTPRARFVPHLTSSCTTQRMTVHPEPVTRNQRGECRVRAPCGPIEVAYGAPTVPNLPARMNNHFLWKSEFRKQTKAQLCLAKKTKTSRSNRGHSGSLSSIP